MTNSHTHIQDIERCALKKAIPSEENNREDLRDEYLESYGFRTWREWANFISNQSKANKVDALRAAYRTESGRSYITDAFKEFLGGSITCTDEGTSSDNGYDFLNNDELVQRLSCITYDTNSDKWVWEDKRGTVFPPADYDYQGRCYQGDGSGSYVEVSGLGDSIILDNYLTICVTFKFEPNVGGFVLAFGGNNAGAVEIETYSSTANFSCNVRDTTNTTYIKKQVSGYSDNLFHTVIFEFVNDDSINVYVDGTSEGSITYTGVLTGLASDFRILCRENLSIPVGFFPNGVFDIRLFNKQLTADEKDSYNNHVYISDAIIWIKGDERAGTISYDSSGDENHGTITNATLSTFHSTQNYYSFQNEYGFTYDEDGSLTGTSGVFIPRDESNPELDVLGNTLEYSGRVKLNVDLVNSNCIQSDGSEKIAIPEVIIDTSENWTIEWECIPRNLGTTSESFLGKDSSSFSSFIRQVFSNNRLAVEFDTTGTNYDITEANALTVDEKNKIKVVINNNQVMTYINDILNKTTNVTNDTLTIDVLLKGYNDGGFTGEFWNFKITNNTTEELLVSYPMSEGKNTIVYDTSGNNSNGTLSSDTVWSTQNYYPYNLINGFDLWQNDSDSEYIRVPFDINGSSILTEGDILTGYTWVSKNPSCCGHNNAETEISQSLAPSLIQADSDIGYWYNHNTPEVEAIVRSYSDILLESDDTNIITNGTFETDTSNWSAIGSTISRDTTTVYEGTGSLKVVDDGSTTYCATRQLAIPTLSNNRYKFSLYVYPEVGTFFRISIRSPSSTGADMIKQDYEVIEGQWNYIECEFISEENTTDVTLYNYYYSEGGSSSDIMYLDNITMTTLNSTNVINDQIFVDTSSDICKKNVLTYSDTQSGVPLFYADKFTNGDQVFLIDSDGQILLDSEGKLLEVTE